MRDDTLPENAAASPLDQAYRIARRRVRALRGWYLHAMVYGSVVGGLWLLFLAQGAIHLTRNGWPRPLPITLGWGLGLLIHGLLVWSRTSPTGRQWETRKIEQFMREERDVREARDAQGTVTR
jgi:2TM domain